MSGPPSRPPGHARSLGGSDPRIRRAGEQPNFGPAFKVDGNGQLTLALELPLIIRNGKPALDITALVKLLPLDNSLALEDGQLAVNRASSVDDLGVGATIQDVIDTVNAMLASEREAGHRST